MDIAISPVLVWFLIGIGCFALELAVPGFIIFFFGIGAWTVAAAIAFVDLALSTQLIVFLAGSLLSLLLLRSYLRSVFLGDSKSQADSVVMDSSPSTGTVIKAINPPAEGKIKYAGSFWRATADSPIPEGSTVEIMEQHDLLVKVRPLKQ